MFSTLLAAATARRLRVGWLDLEHETKVGGPLEEAASLGVLRAVSVAGQRAIAVKPLKGRPVLGDLMREHFSGCLVVLVRSGSPLDAENDWCLASDGERLRLSRGGSEPDHKRELDADALLDRLRSPVW